MNKVLKSVLFIVIALIILGLILYPKFKPEEKGPVMNTPQGSSILPVEGKVIFPKHIEKGIGLVSEVFADSEILSNEELKNITNVLNKQIDL